MFTTNTLLLLLGVTEPLSDDMMRLTVAVWFFSVGYLLWKRMDGSRRLAVAAPVSADEQVLQTSPNIVSQG